MKKRLLTGVKPTWNWMHLWNYFWMYKPFIELSKNYESFLFLPDFHSLTSVHEAEIMRRNKKRLMIELFSLLPEESEVIIFEQSKWRDINNLTRILNSVTPYSLMLRAHAFKDSVNKNCEINMATFNYPILMTSDIIAYDADLVPVWKDQQQHIEFARDIAENFNKTYNTDFFKLPEWLISEEVGTIPWIDGRKMSKSYNNYIGIFDDEKTLKKQIMSIVTDNTPLEIPKNPDTCNVFALIKFFATKEKLEEIRAKYLAWNYGYWHAKLELLDLILKYFKDAREKYKKYEQNFDLVLKRIQKWNQIANGIVTKKYEEIVRLVGLD